MNKLSSPPVRNRSKIGEQAKTAVIEKSTLFLHRNYTKSPQARRAIEINRRDEEPISRFSGRKHRECMHLALVQKKSSGFSTQQNPGNPDNHAVLSGSHSDKRKPSLVNATNASHNKPHKTRLCLRHPDNSSRLSGLAISDSLLIQRNFRGFHRSIFNQCS